MKHQADISPIESPPKGSSPKLCPPSMSKGLWGDIKSFLIHRPESPTLIHFDSLDERQGYSYRIMQRLGVEVTKFKILNIHQIGINMPAKYIFEELINWNGDSSCWPNYIAKVVRRNQSLEHIAIFLFGWMRFPTWFKNSFIGRSFIPLFRLNALAIRKFPDDTSSDNARFLLYETSGGYPIGVFSMYVRSSIEEQQEKEQSQLFLVVGFNFYGHEEWSKTKLVNKIWEGIHDRVSSNVLCRFKQYCEWRFEKIQKG